MSQRYVCVHGHFYQPPRENPWLEAIEQQDSAAPYHDWNERITDECYRPNASARLLDGDGWLTRMASNYERISFNFGPTLLSWLEEEAPDVHEAIVAADRASAERFGGHGSAMAQSYNHLIMPLANERDRITQVRWGIADFESRFGRRPEGMWLSETAADTPTLEALAAEGVRFTLLAPNQARRWRAAGAPEWTDCSTAGVDPSRAYTINLPSGASIAAFFYDGPIAQAVAFEHLLNSGEHFAQRILGAFSDARTGPQLAHIATDGETYGHHHRHGEMALAYALDLFDARDDLRLTNYAEFLELHPPEHEAEIHENSSWSCAHGVERWRSDCGCTTGGRTGWTQAWRAPLRAALDALSARLAEIFEASGPALLADPWRARDAFVAVILDRSESSLQAFFREHGAGPLSPEDRTMAIRLLEMQRHAMLMYTSCGWFFDDLGRIETVQVIRYAARAIQLAKNFTDDDVEGDFLELLEKAWCNGVRRNGRDIWEEEIRPSVTDLTGVGAHYAVLSLFEEDRHPASIYCYEALPEDRKRLSAGRAQLRIGRARLTSRITRASRHIDYAVCHLGGHVINGGARVHGGDGAYDEMAAELAEAFEIADFGKVLATMERAFGTSRYSLSSLFADEQRRVVERVLASTVERLEGVLSALHHEQTPLLRFLGGHGIRPPRAISLPAEFVLYERVLQQIRAEKPEPGAIESLLDEARRDGVSVIDEPLAFEFESMLARVAGSCVGAHDPTEGLVRLSGLVGLLDRIELPVNLAPTQLVVWELLRSIAAGESGGAGLGAEEDALLSRVCETVRVRRPAPAAR